MVKDLQIPCDKYGIRIDLLLSKLLEMDLVWTNDAVAYNDYITGWY